MKNIEYGRLRKCSDINMEHPFFEFVDENEDILFDIARSDTNEIRIQFYDGVRSKSMSIDMFEKLIKEAKQELMEA